MSVERKPDVSEAMARRLAELADSKAATEIVILDMRRLVSYTDFLTICTARNERQARAIADEVKLRLKQEQKLLPAGSEADVAAVMRSLGAEGRATMLEMPQFGVSSSAVRERAAAGRPLRYLVPEAVARLIEEKGI